MSNALHKWTPRQIADSGSQSMPEGSHATRSRPLSYKSKAISLKVWHPRSVRSITQSLSVYISIYT